MQIRKATKEDIPAMREIFNYGREVQLKTGNLNQWEAGYPADEVILEDIRQKAAHVCVDDKGNIIGVLSVFTDPDPTYKNIEGAWLNDKPYATIHRIATNGQVKGTGQYCIEWVQNQYDNVRIDTHENNEQMKYIVKKLGFEYCGVIYLANGDARNAYQFVRND
ncbi:N-acetyltransferase [Carnobacteriaceae bacterium 52-44]